MSGVHYRFAAVADIHIDREDHGRHIYFRYAEENFRRALDTIRQLGCRFIISAGDQITNAAGGEEEWALYRRIIDGSGYAGTVFEALGNHETRFAKYGGCTLEESLADFIRYTKLAEKPVDAPAGRTYYEYLDPAFGDSFLFLSLENGVSTNKLDNFSPAQMDWAEEKLALRTAEGRRVFLIQHAPILRYGAGDDRDDPAYRGSIRLTAEDGTPFPNNRRFHALTKKYRNAIWLSGHTHVDFRDNVNFADENGTACRMLHIPALAGTTRIVRRADGTHMLDRAFHPHVAQGYVADVYEDRTVFRAVNFCGGAVYPQFIYTVPRNST